MTKHATICIGTLPSTWSRISCSGMMVSSPGRNRRCGGEAVTFDEVLEQALEMLRRRGRVSYRALQVQFQPDDTLKVPDYS